jgi:helix-turn-helix protein
VATFNFKQRSQNFEQIFEVEVRKETLLETEKQIKANVAKFADSLILDSNQHS